MTHAGIEPAFAVRETAVLRDRRMGRAVHHVSSLHFLLREAHPGIEPGPYAFAERRPHLGGMSQLAPRAGIEPATPRLTAACSAS